jgi:hypothetical protein
MKNISLIILVFNIFNFSIFASQKNDSALQVKSFFETLATAYDVDKQEKTKHKVAQAKKKEDDFQKKAIEEKFKVLIKEEMKGLINAGSLLGASYKKQGLSDPETFQKVFESESHKKLMLIAQRYPRYQECLEEIGKEQRLM